MPSRRRSPSGGTLRQFLENVVDNDGDTEDTGESVTHPGPRSLIATMNKSSQASPEWGEPAVMPKGQDGLFRFSSCNLFSLSVPSMVVANSLPS